jgi:AcrR family transcriptional regulator
LISVTARRKYDATRRRRQAQQTRGEVLERAGVLFVANGFAGTTMAAIADSADVSVELLYSAWGSKAGIVEALLRSALRGTEEGLPLERSAAVQAIRAEPSAREALRRYGELLATIQPRLAPMVRLLREGAAADPRLAAALETNGRDRLEGMGRLAAHLAELGALAPGVSIEQAQDVLWTLNSSELYELLVEVRGWSPAAYGEWVAEMMAAALLDGVGMPSGG